MLSVRVLQGNCCTSIQLAITLNQGDNTPVSITFPYDITGYTFSGTVNLSPLASNLALSIGQGVTVGDIVSCTGSILNNVLTVSAVAYGTLYIGMPVSGVGIMPGTYIASFGTGTGGVGTYNLNQGQTTASTTIAASTIYLQLTSAQTQNVAPGQYPFDLWTTTPGGSPINTNPVNGYYFINPAITQIS